MYINYNDYELIYLTKEGITPARKLLFDKYSILLKKMYKEGYYYKIYSLYDFIQEGLLILNKAIYSYSLEFCNSFYNYFRICFIRRLSRLSETKEISLCENRVKYKFIDAVDVKTNSIKKLIEREIKNEDDITKRIVSECIFENLSIQSFCFRYNLDYTNTYYLYRKIRHKLEKILTN